MAQQSRSGAVEYTIRSRGKYAARVDELSVSRDSSILSTHEGREEAYCDHGVVHRP